MAAVDKMNEFYTCASRFQFLASVYRPSDLPDEVNAALDVFCKFASDDKKFLESIEDADNYFEKMNEKNELANKAYILGEIVRIVCKYSY